MQFLLFLVILTLKYFDSGLFRLGLGGKKKMEKPKILIVDDEEMIRKIIIDILLPFNFDLIQACDGVEAIEKVEEFPPDVVLLDIAMPRMDGFEVLKRLKENEETKVIPVVMITASNELQMRVRAIELGVDDFLGKPMDMMELKARVKSLIKVKAYNDHMRNYQKKLETEVAERTEEVRLALEKANMYQQQLIQADKMITLGTLVSGIVHEINNPNNFIMLNTPILQEAWRDIIPILEKYYNDNGDFNMGGLKYTEMREYIAKFFSGITDGAKRIKYIVSDLKDFARQGASDMEQLIEVNAVVNSAIALVSNQIKGVTMNFLIEYGNDLHTFKGNHQRLEQVIINLILNACQALNDNKQGIFVSTSYMNDSNINLIKIKDEGEGIPADILPRIVEPFFTTKHDSGGTGLGLPVSLGIIKDHGGELEFSSVEGEGTTALVSLPVRHN